MDFLKYKRLGLSVIPLNFKKEPEWELLPRVNDSGGIVWEPPITDDNKPPSDSRPSWKPYQKEMPSDEICKLWSEKCNYMGIVCGEISGNLHCIDDDEKKNLVGQERLIDRWTKLVKSVDEGLLKKIILTKTVNKGFHILYRTENPLQLETKNPVYAERFPVAGEKGNQALIETRTEGGYYCFYEPVRGSYDNINTLTMEEHNTLVRCAKELNEVFVVEKVGKKVDRGLSTGLSPWEDYDQRTDITIVLDMLLREGWTEVYGGNGDSYRLRRPGKTSGSISATLGHQGSNIFYVFTSNSEFEPEKPYSPFQVLSLLEDGGDWGVTASRLSKEGYGSPMELSEKEELKSKLLQSETLEITDEEEERILSRVKDSSKSMDNLIAFESSGRRFTLSDRFSALLPMMKSITPGQVVGWAAKSGVGKTSSARQVFNDYLKCTEQYGLYVSLEMPDRDISMRNAMEDQRWNNLKVIDRTEVADVLMSDGEFKERVVNEWKYMYTLDDCYDVDEMFAVAEVLQKKLMKEGKLLSVVLMDFLQLAKGGHSVDMQPEIARKFKENAKRLDVIGVPLLQINGSKDKYERPTPDSISGHGAILHALDYLFMQYKNVVDEYRIIFEDGKERWSRHGICDLVQSPMYLTAEEHVEIDMAAVAKKKAEDQGNSKDVL